VSHKVLTQLKNGRMCSAEERNNVSRSQGWFTINRPTRY